MNESVIMSLVNFGEAGAVIIVVVYFLRFIRERDKDWQVFFHGLIDGNDRTLTKLMETMTSHDNKTEKALARMEEHVRLRSARTRDDD